MIHANAAPGTARVHCTEPDDHGLCGTTLDLEDCRPATLERYRAVAALSGWSWDSLTRRDRCPRHTAVPVPTAR